MKSILVTHTDLDGMGIVILSSYFNLPFDKVECYDYDEEKESLIVENFIEYKNIVVADLSLTPALHEGLLSKSINVSVFDHHETSQWISEKPECVWDNQRCGTKIFFDEYIKPRIKQYKPIIREFVDLVDVYDRWVLGSPLRPMAEDLQRVFVKMGSWDIEDTLVRHDRFIMAMLRKLEKLEHFEWNNVELMYIQNAKESENKAYEEALKMLQIRTDNKGRRFALFSAWGKFSMTCSRMLNTDNLDVEYIVVAQNFHNKWGQMSFRSREGQFNLLELAGVAGHKASAGTSLSAEDAQRFLYENLCFKYKIDIKSDDESIIESVNTI